MAASDRFAGDDVRQRRAFQRLAARIEQLESAMASNGLPVDAETPTGTVNGTNLVFGLAFSPITGSLMLFRNGLLLRAGSGNDYTLSAATITFEAGEAPATGAILTAFYRRTV